MALNLPFGVDWARHQVPSCVRSAGTQQAPSLQKILCPLGSSMALENLAPLHLKVLLQKYTTNFFFHFLCNLTDLGSQLESSRLFLCEQMKYPEFGLYSATKSLK